MRVVKNNRKKQRREGLGSALSHPQLPVSKPSIQFGRRFVQKTERLRLEDTLKIRRKR